MAKLLSALMGAIGIDVPRTATVYAPHTFVISIAAGLVVTLLASLGPALRATRVPPIAAVREGATLPRGRFAQPATDRLGAAARGALAGCSDSALFGSIAQTSQRLLMLAAGCALFFVAVALLSAYFVRPLARVVGSPGSILGGASGKLARENAMRAPARTASTAAALMIGLALVTFVSVLAHGLARSTEVAIRKQASTDYVVMAKDGYSTYSNAVAGALARVPGVEKRRRASRRHGDRLREGSRDHRLRPEARPARSTASTGRRDRTPRSPGSAAAERSSTDTFANKHKLEPGSPLPGDRCRTGAGSSLHVVAINKQPELISLLGDITVSQASFDAAYRTPKTTLITYLRTKGGQSKTVAARSSSALDGLPERAACRPRSRRSTPRARA